MRQMRCASKTTVSLLSSPFPGWGRRAYSVHLHIIVMNLLEKRAFGSTFLRLKVSRTWDEWVPLWSSCLRPYIMLAGLHIICQTQLGARPRCLAVATFVEPPYSLQHSPLRDVRTVECTLCPRQNVSSGPLLMGLCMVRSHAMAVCRFQRVDNFSALLQWTMGSFMTNCVRSSTKYHVGSTMTSGLLTS